MGKRGKKCPICVDSILAAKADALLQTGSSYSEVAALVGVDKHKVGRHARHSTQTTAAASTSEDLLAASDARLAELAQRMELAWLSCCNNADVKTGTDVLKSLVKLALEDRSRIQRRQESEQTAKTTDGMPSREWISGVVEKVRNAYQRAIDNGAVWCPCCGRTPVDPAKVLGRIKFYESSNPNIAN